MVTILDHIPKLLSSPNTKRPRRTEIDEVFVLLMVLAYFTKAPREAEDYLATAIGMIRLPSP